MEDWMVEFIFRRKDMTRGRDGRLWDNLYNNLYRGERGGRERETVGATEW